MSDIRTIVGRVGERGILPMLELALTEKWTGAMRVKRSPLAGIIWIVKGEVIHASLTGNAELDGPEAFEAVAGWMDGEYILEAGILPPQRTIRTTTTQLMRKMREHVSSEREQFPEIRQTAVVGRVLLQVFDGLRERVPGLESLSLMRGPVCEATTSHDATEMDWMDRQLKSFFADEQNEPDTLFVQEGEHSLLILKQGGMATVLSARTGTTPEALFWAGAEAQRRVMQTAKPTLSER